MQEDYLAKWLNNELTEEELKVFEKSAEYASFQRIVKASDALEAPHYDADSAWKTLQERTTKSNEKVVVLYPFKQFLRVAAVIAVIITGAFLYLNATDETFKTKMAERSEIMLPDASEIILNADSRLSFSEKNWDKERNVSLKGEAFFKVAKGKKFTVSTESGIVTVLGTQFNVENRDGFFEVTCFEGLVSVTYKGHERKLPAGHSFVAYNGTILNDPNILADVPSWVNQESSFKSIPLKFVLAELERQFDITVTTENVDLKQHFTGTFSNTDLKLALESISAPSRIRYTLGEDNVLFYAEDSP